MYITLSIYSSRIYVCIYSYYIYIHILDPATFHINTVTEFKQVHFIYYPTEQEVISVVSLISFDQSYPMFSVTPTSNSHTPYSLGITYLSLSVFLSELDFGFDFEFDCDFDFGSGLTRRLSAQSSYHSHSPPFPSTAPWHCLCFST